MLKEQSMSISKEALKVLLAHLDVLVSQKDKYFGNARNVRKLVTTMTENQNLRIASLSKEDRKNKNISMIQLEDVKKSVKDSQGDVFEHKRIGFRAKSNS